MITLSFRESFKMIQIEADIYNHAFKDKVETKNGNLKDDLSQMLRVPHKHLLEKILKAYAAQLHKQQSHDMKKITDLPSFSTNNVALATMVGCSPRNIRLLLCRIMDAKLITGKIFHGSKANFELKINPKLIYIINKGEPKSVISLFKRLLKTATKRDNSLDQKASSSTGSHASYSRSNNTTPNTSPKGRTGKLLHIADQEIIDNLEAIKTTRNQQENAGSATTDKWKTLPRKETTNNINNRIKEVDDSVNNFGRPNVDANFSTNTTIRKTTRPNYHRTPPVAPPPQLPLGLHADCNYYMSKLASQMVQMLFLRLPFLHQNQTSCIQDYLSYEFENCQTKRDLKNTFNDIGMRIILASRYVEKDPSTRYIPIPTKYLDPDNKHGFESTKIWLEKMKKSRSRKEKCMDEMKHFFKMWKNYSKAVNSYFKNPSLASYRKSHAFLSKKDPAFAKAFDHMVVNDTPVKFEERA